MLNCDVLVVKYRVKCSIPNKKTQIKLVINLLSFDCDVLFLHSLMFRWLNVWSIFSYLFSIIQLFSSSRGQSSLCWQSCERSCQPGIPVKKARLRPHGKNIPWPRPFCIPLLFMNIPIKTTELCFRCISYRGTCLLVPSLPLQLCPDTLLCVQQESPLPYLRTLQSRKSKTLHLRCSL